MVSLVLHRKPKSDLSDNTSAVALQSPTNNRWCVARPLVAPDHEWIASAFLRAQKKPWVSLVPTSS